MMLKGKKKDIDAHSEKEKNCFKSGAGLFAMVVDH